MIDNSGVYIGRFQPFHKGHAEAINYILDRVDFVYIVIGSANRSYEPRNPFTASERIRMIRTWMQNHPKNEKILKSSMLLPLADNDTNSSWVAAFYDTVPLTDMIFTHNPMIKALFGAKERVVELPSFSLRQYSGTNVRKQMAEGGDWKNLVPVETAEVVEYVGGVERVKLLSMA